VTLADGRRIEVGQANNVFIFPGVGLGAIVAEASTVTDQMFLLAAHELAAAVTDARLATGALYPPVTALRDVSRSIAIAVAREAGTLDDPGSAVEAAMWWPEYVPYLPARPAERRRSTET
jgi:malic enzyme